MASNQFGNIFRITTWGESHGKAIGVIIDGCPAGLKITEEEIEEDLKKRAPGKNPFVSPRKEKEKVEILSGVFEKKSTGAPICLLIENRDVQSKSYTAIKNLFRPGHANFSYVKKYGIFDYRGGGRASARETACRVAAGSIAKKFLKAHKIQTLACLKQLGDIQMQDLLEDFFSIKSKKEKSPLFCPCEKTEQKMIQRLQELKKEGDSTGGVVEFYAMGLPVGLGDPVYEKLEANLAKAMMSIPATKGFEIGGGFQLAKMRGSQANDPFIVKEEKVTLKTNHSGGVLGGISTGMPLEGRVAFKPTSSIFKKQETVDMQKRSKTFQLTSSARHDPCVAIRAVPVVEAMLNLVLIDAILMNQSSHYANSLSEKSFSL